MEKLVAKTNVAEVVFSDLKKHKCPHINCSETTRSKTKCLEHLRKHHESSSYHYKQPGSEKEFRNHTSSFSAQKEADQHKFICNKCGFSSSHKSSLCRHKKQRCRASHGQKYECRYCNATMLIYKEYLEHLKGHQKYHCTYPKCGKEFHSLTGFRQHYEMHQPRLLCENCGKFISFVSGLRNHKRKYHGARVPTEGDPQVGAYFGRHMKPSPSRFTR
ncbi:hypothetical protein LOAG_13794 [Loa loa]|uniref:C2H2-type domain-containing protein n=1 Tax=Loa loa TaxID=7209 RepID=A0A1S0TJB3_LOALO|nr:hypothetical protein LOAG_13794 [Loa loa]EFO14724.1 hypothetical protein LOAG_13794 [Loa loa]